MTGTIDTLSLGSAVRSTQRWRLTFRCTHKVRDNLGRFSINYFSGLGLWFMVRVWVRVWVGVSVVIWSG